MAKQTTLLAILSRHHKDHHGHYDPNYKKPVMHLVKKLTDFIKIYNLTPP